MDGIQTKIFCPECGREVELILEKQEVPDRLYQMMKMLGIPTEGEKVYEGKEECACGKIIKITFILKAVLVNKEPHGEIAIRSGVQ